MQVNSSKSASVDRPHERGGRLLTLDHRPWDEGYKAARQGDYDGTLPYIASADRREDFAGLASRPLTEVLIRVFSRAADAVSFHSEQDLRGLIACRPRGYYTHDLDPMLAEGLIELRRADSIADCFRGLAEGGVDFVPVNRFTAAEAIRSAGLDHADFAMAERPLHVDTLHLLISPRASRSAEILRHIDEALADMESRGDLHNLRVGHIARLREAGLAGPWGVDDTASRADAGETSPSEPRDADTGAAEEPEEMAVAETEAGDEPQTEGAEADAVVLLSGSAYAPFADPDLQHGGMTSKIVQRALALQETQALVRFRSWPAAQQAVADGSHPATFPWIKTDRRKRDFRFSDPLYAAPVMIFAAADSDLEFTAYNDLRNTRSCKTESYYRSDIDHLVAAGFISIIETPDLHACFRRVAAGDADFLMVNRFTGLHELQRSDDVDATAFRMLERPIAEIELRVMTATDADELLEHINAGLDALARSGELQAIQERHIETHLTTRGRHAR